MNINIEVDTSNASDLMFQAEDVEMVDDIVRLLMGDGSVAFITETPTIYESEEEEEEEEEVDLPQSDEEEEESSTGVHTDDVGMFAEEELEVFADPNDTETYTVEGRYNVEEDYDKDAATTVQRTKGF